MCGLDVAKAEIAELSDYVGSVFQNPRTQFFNTDTDSEIVFGLENRALPQGQLKKRLEETYSDLEMSGLRRRNIFELSGGEKQKIAFASVYATQPEVLVLDEPSSNLDMAAVAELTRLLQGARKNDHCCRTSALVLDGSGRSGHLHGKRQGRKGYGHI